MVKSNQLQHQDRPLYPPPPTAFYISLPTSFDLQTDNLHTANTTSNQGGNGRAGEGNWQEIPVVSRRCT